MDQYIFAGAVSLMALVVGLILLYTWHVMRRSLDNRKMRFLERFVMNRGKRAVIEVMSECMDMMPEKIMEAKRAIDEEGM